VRATSSGAAVCIEAATQERFLGQICIFIACQNQLVRESVTPAVNQSLCRRRSERAAQLAFLYVHMRAGWLAQLLFNWIAIPIVSL
jgi:hypothetical protein